MDYTTTDLSQVIHNISISSPKDILSSLFLSRDNDSSHLPFPHLPLPLPPVQLYLSPQSHPLKPFQRSAHLGKSALNHLSLFFKVCL